MSNRISRVRVVPGDKIVVTKESGRGFSLRKGEMLEKLRALGLSCPKMKHIHLMAYTVVCGMAMDKPTREDEDRYIAATEVLAELRLAIEELGCRF